MKIYDARANGGFFVVPPPPPCAASDECHGPGTAGAGRPHIGTVAGTRRQALAATKCKKGSVKKHGKCVAKKHHHGKRHRRHRARHG